MPHNPTSPAPQPRPVRPKNWRRRLSNWLHLSWGDRLLLGEALLLLGLGRATVLFLPFKRVAPYLGQAQEETPFDAPSSPAPQIARAIARASRYTPWTSNCFAQALAGHLMLRRRQAACTLYLGVHKNGDAFSAHAWLRNGNLIVTGGGVHRQFTVIARYGWQPHKPQDGEAQKGL